MSPVLSTMSGLSARAFGFGYNFASSAFEHIETQTVGSGGAASITFSSIPGTYKHLQIRAVTRTTSAATENGGYLRFNGDTGASSYYPLHYLLGDGASATSGANGSLGARIDLERFAGGGAAASIFGTSIIDILDYVSTSKYKTTRTLGAVDRNGAGTIWFASGLWLSTSAITSITMLGDGAYNFAQHSTFSLYGLR